MDLKLNSLGDLDLTDNEISLVGGIESVEQDWRSRIQTFKGEWFLDTRIGVPYFQEVFKKNPNIAVLRSVFYEASLGTPGIKEITTFNLTLDAARRILNILIDGTAEDLTNFRFVYEEMILSQNQEAD